MPGPNLDLRIISLKPPAGVSVALQTGKGSAGVPTGVAKTTGGDMEFSVPLTVSKLEAGSVSFSGPFVQKDDKGQFVYLRWGRSAGDPATCVDRRTKVYLHLLTADLVARALESGDPLCLSFEGTAKDGHPACATVPVRLGP